MRCEDIRKEWDLRVGALTLDDKEKEHIAGCPECAAYYKRLAAMGKEIRSLAVPSLSATEFAVVQGNLDERISQYRSRAGRFYRLTMKLGVGVATIALLLLVIYIGRWSANQGVTTTSSGRSAGGLSIDSAISQIYAAMNSTSDQVVDTTTEDSLDDKYVKVVVGNFTGAYGVGASDALWGIFLKKKWNI